MTDQDYELLSAYIDGMLTTGERTRLEARLQTEPELQRELNALRETIALVKALPALTAPRNFTLTAEMVQPLKVVRFPLLSALSAVAAMILILAGVLLLTNTSDTPTTNLASVDVALQPTPVMTLTVQQPEVMSQVAEPFKTSPPPGTGGGAAAIVPAAPLPTQPEMRAMTAEQPAELYESEAMEEAPMAADEADDGVITDQATGGSIILEATEIGTLQSFGAPEQDNLQEQQVEREEAPTSARNTVSTALIGAGVALLILAAITYLRSRTG